jgi:hypothetical protein
VGGAVDGEIVEGENRLRGTAATAKNGANARIVSAKAKGLAMESSAPAWRTRTRCSTIEAPATIRIGRSGFFEQNLSKNVQAGNLGPIEIENNQIIWLVGSETLNLVSVGYELHGELLLQ